MTDSQDPQRQPKQRLSATPALEVDDLEVDDRTAAQKAEDEAYAAELQEFVYGTITVLVALGALGGSLTAPVPREAIAVIIGVTFATLLAHSFSAVMALHVRLRRPARSGEIGKQLSHSWRIMLAAVPALVTFLVADLGLISPVAAIRISLALAVLALMWMGLIAAQRSQSTFLGGVMFVGAATLIGLCIVAIELYVHHT
ncbi:MAG: hypothetical protein F2942_04005 [Actinobacteria bacterium]|uniref:Unannotated protein n=2 Tax=freshwater metagenome TaxID=449393 RepID=A0A6J7MXU7_9ZZZZ|nr:hypothetical protein [Actinomycetota bacterium]MTA73862.1 hypothetical protein [Actinomycetota bacterium]